MTIAERNARIAVEVLKWRKDDKGWWWTKEYGRASEPPNFISDDSTMAMLVNAIVADGLGVDFIYSVDSDETCCDIGVDTAQGIVLGHDCHAALIAAIEQMIESGGE